MVWGFITIDGPGELFFVEGMMNSEKYVNMLKTVLIPNVHRYFNRRQQWIFQQDSAPCHTSKYTMEFLRSQGFRVLRWAGNSPDVNPIENVWNVLKMEVSANHNCKNKSELIAAIKHEWENSEKVKQAAIKAMLSMPQRIKDVKDAKGFATRY